MVKTGSEPLVITSLRERPDLLGSFCSFIESYFPQGEKLSQKTAIADEFSLLLEDKNRENCFVMIQKGQIVSSAAYRHFEFKLPYSLSHLKIAGIGLVVTHPDSRKQGFSNFLTANLEKKAFREGACLSVLWSDLYDFYSKQGYLLAGRESQWSLDKNIVNEKPWSSASVSKLNIKDLNKLQALYEGQGIGPIRDFSKYQKFSKLSDTYIRVIEDKDRVVAYAVWGKARDLRGTLHEIIGNEEACKSLIKNFSESFEAKSMKIQLPPLHPLENLLDKEFDPHEGTALGFFKILNRIDFVNHINPLIKKQCDCQLKNLLHGFQLIDSQNQLLFESSDYGHLLQLFMSPFPLKELSDLEPKIQKALAGWQGLPIYFWGLDSV